MLLTEISDRVQTETKLAALKVAIVSMDGFEEPELVGPRTALKEAGVTVHVISKKSGSIQGYHNDKDPAKKVDVDFTFDQVDPDDYDAVVVPGGVLNSDSIRLVTEAQDFVRTIDEADKMVAVICHGGWLLISAGLVEGRTMTSWHSIQDDLRNAGATWVDKEVVEEGNLISSRSPKDIDAFNRKIIQYLSKD